MDEYQKAKFQKLAKKTLMTVEAVLFRSKYCGIYIRVGGPKKLIIFRDVSKTRQFRESEVTRRRIVIEDETTMPKYKQAVTTATRLFKIEKPFSQHFSLTIFADVDQVKIDRLMNVIAEELCSTINERVDDVIRGHSSGAIKLA
jgi:hypothetical protein